MANVFGDPITDWTLKEMKEFRDKEITPVDRARVAIRMKSAGMKDTNARTYVENLKKQYSAAGGTLCFVYNATGNNLTFLANWDWCGIIGQAPFPMLIQNGQWGVFLHAKGSEATAGATVGSGATAGSGAKAGSVAGVVYRGQDPWEGQIRDYMLAWSNSSVTSVWTEAREKGHYTPTNVWDEIRRELNVTHYYHSDAWHGCLSTITTGSDNLSEVEARFTAVDVYP